MWVSFSCASFFDIDIDHNWQLTTILVTFRLKPIKLHREREREGGPASRNFSGRRRDFSSREKTSLLGVLWRRRRNKIATKHTYMPVQFLMWVHIELLINLFWKRYVSVKWPIFVIPNQSHTECNVAQSKNCPFRVSTTIELKNIATTSYNSGIWRDMFQPTGMPVLSGVVFLFLSSTVVLTPIRQYLGCATVAVSERYKL
jgi:hypothetical protein